MRKIERAFARLRSEGRGGLIPFITAGDPNLETTGKLLVELSRAGASIIELGIPFSDPMADGPVIQRASERALRHDVGIREILDVVASVQPDLEGVPVVLFSYFNPLLQYRLERLCVDAAEAGVAGLLVTDLAPEEASDLTHLLSAQGLDLIFLVAPTSTDTRLRLIAERASGFIYAVSRAGVTGEQAELSHTAEILVRRVREASKLPVAVGFGISTATQVRETLRYADAAVVGSTIVAEIERLKGDPDLPTKIGTFTRKLLRPNEEAATDVRS